MVRQICQFCFVVGLIAGCSEKPSPPNYLAREPLTRAERLERLVESRGVPPSPPANAGVELSQDEKVRVIEDPLHVQARAASIVRDAERAAKFASQLALAPEETRQFLAIMADHHDARLSIIEFRKQNRNLDSVAFRERMHAELPSSVLARASAASLQKQLKILLGEEQYAMFLRLLDVKG